MILDLQVAYQHESTTLSERINEIRKELARRKAEAKANEQPTSIPQYVPQGYISRPPSSGKVPSPHIQIDGPNSRRSVSPSRSVGKHGGMLGLLGLKASPDFRLDDDEEQLQQPRSGSHTDSDGVPVRAFSIQGERSGLSPMPPPPPPAPDDVHRLSIPPSQQKDFSGGTHRSSSDALDSVILPDRGVKVSPVGHAVAGGTTTTGRSPRNAASPSSNALIAFPPRGGQQMLSVFRVSQHRSGSVTPPRNLSVTTNTLPMLKPVSPLPTPLTPSATDLQRMVEAPARARSSGGLDGVSILELLDELDELEDTKLKLSRRHAHELQILEAEFSKHQTHEDMTAVRGIEAEKFFAKDRRRSRRSAQQVHEDLKLAEKRWRAAYEAFFVAVEKKDYGQLRYKDLLELKSVFTSCDFNHTGLIEPSDLTQTVRRLLLEYGVCARESERIFLVLGFEPFSQFQLKLKEFYAVGKLLFEIYRSKRHELEHLEMLSRSDLEIRRRKAEDDENRRFELEKEFKARLQAIESRLLQSDPEAPEEFEATKYERKLQRQIWAANASILSFYEIELARYRELKNKRMKHPFERITAPQSEEAAIRARVEAIKSRCSSSGLPPRSNNNISVVQPPTRYSPNTIHQVLQDHVEALKNAIIRAPFDVVARFRQRKREAKRDQPPTSTKTDSPPKSNSPRHANTSARGEMQGTPPKCPSSRPSRLQSNGSLDASQSRKNSSTPNLSLTPKAPSLAKGQGSSRPGSGAESRLHSSRGSRSSSDIPMLVVPHASTILPHEHDLRDLFVYITQGTGTLTANRLVDIFAMFTPQGCFPCEGKDFLDELYNVHHHQQDQGRRSPSRPSQEVTHNNKARSVSPIETSAVANVPSPVSEPTTVSYQLDFERFLDISPAFRQRCLEGVYFNVLPPQKKAQLIQKRISRRLPLRKFEVTELQNLPDVSGLLLGGPTVSQLDHEIGTQHEQVEWEESSPARAYA